MYRLMLLSAVFKNDKIERNGRRKRLIFRGIKSKEIIRDSATLLDTDTVIQTIRQQ